MRKRSKETQIEVIEADVERAVRRILAAVIPLKIDSLHMCAALHYIIEDLRNQGVEMDVIPAEPGNLELH